MTLKHKNSSKWAKRILQRGLTTQDNGTRAAIAEQLHQHALLTRKMNSMKDSSSSEESSDEDDDDENSAGSDQDKDSSLLAKAKEKTLKVFEEDDEIPNTGVLSLPFMVISLIQSFFYLKNKKLEPFQLHAEKRNLINRLFFLMSLEACNCY